jgi:peptide/nickel transport system permease protein
MSRYIIRRVLLMIPILFGMSIIAFVVSRAIPVNPIEAAIGQQASDHPAIVAAYTKEWGLNKPLVVQYLTYMWNLLHGNLGISIYTQRPVLTDLKTFMPATIELATGAILISLLVSVPLGVLAAMRRGGWIDRIVRLVTLIGVAMPLFWLALLLITLFYVHWPIFPGPGRLGPTTIPPPRVTGLYTIDSILSGQWGTLWDALYHLALPCLCLSTWSMGLLTRITRAGMLSVLPQGYLQVARSKGASERHVIWRHAWRNATIPVITVAGLAYGDLLTGAILIETIFSWDGIGSYAYQSSINADFPAIMGVALLFGVIYLVVNLVVDILYAFVDPRVRSAMTVKQQ